MKKLLIPTIVAAFSMTAFAQDAAKTADEAAKPEAAGACKVVIEGNDAMKYNLDKFTINKTECPEFTVELDHVGKLPAAAMGHNVVITAKSDMDGVAKDGIAAGAAHDYIKEGDERVIAHTKLIGGGEKAEITFSTKDLAAGGDYEFFCSYPGHYAMMKGQVEVTE